MTDDQVLVEVVGGLNASECATLRRVYSEMFEKDLIVHIKKNTSGNFEEALVASLTPPVEFDCFTLHHALDRFSSDESTLSDILCTRTQCELRQIQQAYEHLHGRNLVHMIEAHTSGDTKKLYLARLLWQERDDESLDRDVKLLYDAGEGRLLGCDEVVFTNILACRSPEYIANLNVRYSETHGKSLEKVIKSKMSGHFETALVALVTPVPIYFAQRLHAATKGLGNDNACVIRVIVSQRERHLGAIAEEYLLRYNESLLERLRNECSGDYKKLLVAVTKKAVQQ